jgi:hypothetical protein
MFQQFCAAAGSDERIAVSLTARGILQHIGHLGHVTPAGLGIEQLPFGTDIASPCLNRVYFEKRGYVGPQPGKAPTQGASGPNCQTMVSKLDAIWFTVCYNRAELALRRS